MKILQPFAFVIFLFFSEILFASSPVKVQQFINHKDWNFVENKGQIPPSGKPACRADRGAGGFNTDIKYYGHQGGVYLYCKPGMLSFVFTKVENEQGQVSEATGSSVETQCLRLNHASAISRPPLPQDAFNASLQKNISTARTDLVLIGSNPNAKILASDQQEYYENYYTTGDADHGITNVHTFKTVTYNNIYPNIDMVLNCREQGIEYSFIVHPKGKVGDIQLQWSGTKATKALANGGFKFSNSLGTLVESAPKSFAEGKLVQSSFEKRGFKVGNYDKRENLVIDPALIWATYYGGYNENDDNGDGGCIADNLGNVYITGYTSHSSGIASSGSYQSSIAGANDAYIAKFNNKGKLIWSTYYGGKNPDEANSITLDDSANVYIAGYTKSSSGIATFGTFQTSLIGLVDAFLAKFNANGILKFGTYFGQGSEIAYGISVDGFGNAYITGNTSSNSGIATNGAYQTSYSGNVDAFLAKFDEKGGLIWATYYGGTDLEGAYGITADHAGNAYIVGNTQSSSGIATNGAFQTSYIGFGYAYLAKFKSSGALEWATYFGGIYGSIAYCVSKDDAGNVYMAGRAGCDGLATSGAYQTSNNSNVDGNGFLVKFNSNGIRLWATYFGGPTGETIRALCLDGIGNIFITGITNGHKGLATPGAFETASLTNGEDVFMSKFNNYGSIQYSTYFGGYFDQQSNGISTDTFGDVFISGYTLSDNALATSGAYETSLDDYPDAFLAKFDLLSNDAGINSFSSFTGTLCGGNNNVIVKLENFGMDTLKTVKIYYSINGKLQSPYNWAGTLIPYSLVSVKLGELNLPLGRDTIKVWTSYPNGVKDSMPFNDSIVFIGNFLQSPNTIVGKNVAICIGGGDTLGAASVSGNTYSWKSIPSGFTSSYSKPFVKPNQTTTYILTQGLSSTGCSISDSVTITVNQLPKAKTIANSTICLGTAVYLGDTSVLGSTYSWASTPSGFASTDANPTVSPTSAISYTLTETNSNGCVKSNSVILTINPLPIAKTIINTTICSGNSISIGATIIPGDKYNWISSPLGFSSKSSNPVVKPNITTVYFLTETNAFGCSKSDSIIITVNPLPNVHWTNSYSGNSVVFHAIDSLLPMLSYDWNFGDGDSANGPDPIHLFPKNKSYTIILQIRTSNGCVKILDSVLNVTRSDIKELNPGNFFLNIFPNPFQSTTTIAYNLNHASKINIALIDITGKQIGTLINENQVPGDYQININAEKYHLNPGIYLLKFMMDDEVVSRRLVKF